MARILETIYLDSSAQVDAEKGEIRGVKLLGMESKNKRRYTLEAMTNAVPLYQGRKVYVDHPKRAEIESDRSMDRWAGTIKNVRFSENGIYGDIKLRKKSDFFDGIIEAAQDFPMDVGFSHVADGESRMDKDTEIVESIKEVFSVDLVTDPATTHGLFESRRPTKNTKTVKGVIESLPDGVQRTRLIEMMDDGYIDGSMSMTDDETPVDPLTQMSGLVKELITMLGETLKVLAMKKDTPAPDAKPDPVAPLVPEEELKKEPAVDATPNDPASGDPMATEQNKKFPELESKLAMLEAKTLLLESGREATPVRIKALAAAAEADRKELLESWPQKNIDLAERPLRSPALLESEGLSEFDFSQPGSFAARYR